LSREFVPGLRVRKVARVAVLSVEVWERVVRQPGRMILLLLFDDPDVTAALEHNHHVDVFGVDVGRRMDGQRAEIAQIPIGAAVELGGEQRLERGGLLECRGPWRTRTAARFPVRERAWPAWRPSSGSASVAFAGGCSPPSATGPRWSPASPAPGLLAYT
jgi:hypothetical protein